MGIESFRGLISTAYESRISLAEMRSCQKTLISLGVGKKVAEEQIPYGKVCNRYQKAGKYDANKERILKGEEKEPYGMRTIYLRSSLRTLRYGHPRIIDVSRS